MWSGYNYGPCRNWNYSGTQDDDMWLQLLSPLHQLCYMSLDVDFDKNAALMLVHTLLSFMLCHSCTFHRSIHQKCYMPLQFLYNDVSKTVERPIINQALTTAMLRKKCKIICLLSRVLFLFLCIYISKGLIGVLTLLTSHPGNCVLWVLAVII